MIRNRAKRRAGSGKPKGTEHEKTMGFAAELLRLKREQAAKLTTKVIPLKRKKAT
jgi:hypothetical protein